MRVVSFAPGVDPLLLGDRDRARHFLDECSRQSREPFEGTLQLAHVDRGWSVWVLDQGTTVELGEQISEHRVGGLLMMEAGQEPPSAGSGVRRPPEGIYVCSSQPRSDEHDAISEASRERLDQFLIRFVHLH